MWMGVKCKVLVEEIGTETKSITELKASVLLPA